MSASDEPALVAYLGELDISARAVEGGVLVIDHYALLDLLEGAQEPESPARGPAPAAPRRPKPLDPDAPNPVGCAQEYCQALGKPLPEYRTETVGNEHLPMFRVTASALGKQGQAEAHNKTQAKEGAARALLRELQAARRARHG